MGRGEGIRRRAKRGHPPGCVGASRSLSLGLRRHAVCARSHGRVAYQHMQVHVRQEALRQHEARRLAVHGGQHEKEARQVEVELAEARDGRAERDHEHGHGDPTRWQRLTEQRLHHHRHDGREALEDLDEGDGKIEVRGVAGAQSGRREHPNSEDAPPPVTPRHLVLQRHQRAGLPDQHCAADGGRRLVECGEQDWKVKLACGQQIFVAHYEHRADKHVHGARQHGETHLPHRLALCCLLAFLRLVLHLNLHRKVVIFVVVQQLLFRCAGGRGNGVRLRHLRVEPDR